MATDDKVIRIQADKLCELIGLPKGSYIPRSTIELIAKSKLLTVVNINGRDIKVTPSLIAVAQVILGKI